MTPGALWRIAAEHGASAGWRAVAEHQAGAGWRAVVERKASAGWRAALLVPSWVAPTLGAQPSPARLPCLKCQHRLQATSTLGVRIGRRLRLAGGRHQALPLGAGTLRSHAHLGLQAERQGMLRWGITA